jgi:hypothetical protein
VGARTKLSEVAQAAAQEAVTRLSASAGAEELIDLADDEARIALASVEGVGTARFRLERVSGAQEDRGAICYLSIAELDPVDVGARFGPGDYRVRGVRPDNSYIPGTSGKFSVSRSIVRRVEPGPEVQRPARLDRYDEWERREEARAARSREFWQALALPLSTVAAAWLNRKPDLDMGPVLIACLSSRGGGGVSDELLKALVLDRMKSGGNDGAVIDAAIKLADKIQGAPDGGGDSWVSVLKEFAPAAAQLLAARRQGTQAAPNGAPPHGSPSAGQPSAPLASVRPVTLPSSTPNASPNSSRAQPSPPGSPPSATTDSTAPHPPSSVLEPAAPLPSTPSNSGNGAAAMGLDPNQQMLLNIAMPWLRHQATNLENWARVAMAPDLAAETLQASLPPLFSRAVAPAQFLEWLNRHDWWTVVVEFHPGLIDFKGWCDAVRGELIELFEEDAAGPEDEDPPAREHVNGEGATDER